MAGHGLKANKIHVEPGSSFRVSSDKQHISLSETFNMRSSGSYSASKLLLNSNYNARDIDDAEDDNQGLMRADKQLW
jgi:hypothetical protein